MSRRTSSDAAAAAAAAASEAARTLQARGQELKTQTQLPPKAEKPQAPPEPKAEPKAKVEADEAPELSNERIAKLRDSNPADKIREEFAERNLKQYTEQTVPQEAEAGKPAEEPKPEEPKAEATEPPKEPVAPPQPETPPEAVKTVRVKVDGEEFDAPAEEVDAAGGVKLYQLQKASEKRLKLATDTLAEVKRLASLQPPPPPQKPAEPTPSDAEFIASKVDAIRFGTQQESAAALQEILSRANKQPEPQALIEQAVNRIKHDQAVAEFDREFSDLVKNPMLLDLIYVQRNKRVQMHIAERRPIDWKNLYTTIGHEVRNLIGRPSQPASAPAATTGTTSQPSEKEARKASIVNLPAAAARVEAPKEQKEPSREDILNEMKKSRMVWRD